MTVGGDYSYLRVWMTMKIVVRFKSKSIYQLERGIKTCTTRSKKLGNPDNTFFVRTTVGIKRYKFTKVIKVPLSTVYYYYYKQEGYYTKEEFGKMWINLHPIRGLDMKWQVWLHLFEEIPLGV